MRLLKRHQFKRMMHHCSHLTGQWIVIDTRSNRVSHTRLWITVTRRYGDAHERNRFKRITREAFRLCYPKIRVGFDLNVKPRSSAKTAKTSDIINDLLRLLNKGDASDNRAIGDHCKGP